VDPPTTYFDHERSTPFLPLARPLSSVHIDPLGHTPKSVNDAQGRDEVQCHKNVRLISTIIRTLSLTLILVHYLGLHFAAVNGDVDLVESPSRTGNLYSIPPPHAASSGGDDLVVTPLIEQGAEVDTSRQLRGKLLASVIVTSSISYLLPPPSRFHEFQTISFPHFSL